MKRTRPLIVVAAALGLALGAGAWSRSRADAPKHPTPTSPNGNLVVELCDGETAAEVPGVKEGESLTRDQAQKVSDSLMAEWRKKHPEANWESSDDAPRLADAKSGGGGFLGLFGKDEAKEPAAAPAKEATPAAPEPAAKPGAVQDGHTYGSFGERDQKIWQAATQEFVKKGDHIFHDAKALGGTIAVSCDMCHPNASNTHPETYPKFQVQLGRVALLRDMINWCIQNPVRGKPLDDNDVRLKALEAYILAERKGVPLDFGKH